MPLDSSGGAFLFCGAHATSGEQSPRRLGDPEGFRGRELSLNLRVTVSPKSNSHAGNEANAHPHSLTSSLEFGQLPPRYDQPDLCEIRQVNDTLPSQLLARLRSRLHQVP